MASGNFDSNEPYHRFIDRQHPDNYRQVEIQALRQAILAKENRLLLGMPDIGLSNLLRFLVTRTDWGERKVIFAYLNCDALDDCLHHQLFFDEITHQFHEQGLGNDIGETLQGYERLKRFLQKIQGDPLNRLVVVVNKAERLLAAADEAYFRRLKALTDLNKYLIYVFAAGLPVAEVIKSDETLFAGRTLHIGPFNERDIAGAIVEEGQRLETIFSLVEGNQLAHLTGGHPGLLRAVSSAVVQEKLDLSEPETILVKRFLARGDVKGRCERILSVLDSKQQNILMAIAEGEPGSQDQDMLTWFENFGFITKQEGNYRLFSPILEKFIAYQDKMEPKDIAIIDGKVFKGAKEIHFRPRAYSLLALLMTEPGHIFSHDELALGVWKSYEVNSDMITKVISELRKELGKDCIKTHHGRGYEFVASH